MLGKPCLVVGCGALGISPAQSLTASVALNDLATAIHDRCTDVCSGATGDFLRAKTIRHLLNSCCRIRFLSVLRLPFLRKEVQGIFLVGDVGRNDAPCINKAVLSIHNLVLCKGYPRVLSLDCDCVVRRAVNPVAVLHHIAAFLRRLGCIIGDVGNVGFTFCYWRFGCWCLRCWCFRLPSWSHGKQERTDILPIPLQICKGLVEPRRFLKVGVLVYLLLLFLDGFSRCGIGFLHLLERIVSKHLLIECHQFGNPCSESLLVHVEEVVHIHLAVLHGKCGLRCLRRCRRFPGLGCFSFRRSGGLRTLHCSGEFPLGHGAAGVPVGEVDLTTVHVRHVHGGWLSVEGDCHILAEKGAQVLSSLLRCGCRSLCRCGSIRYLCSRRVKGYVSIGVFLRHVVQVGHGDSPHTSVHTDRSAVVLRIGVDYLCGEHLPVGGLEKNRLPCKVRDGFRLTSRTDGVLRLCVAFLSLVGECISPLLDIVFGRHGHPAIELVRLGFAGTRAVHVTVGDKAIAAPCGDAAVRSDGHVLRCDEHRLAVEVRHIDIAVVVEVLPDILFSFLKHEGRLVLVSFLKARSRSLCVCVFGESRRCLGCALLKHHRPLCECIGVAVQLIIGESRCYGRIVRQLLVVLRIPGTVRLTVKVGVGIGIHHLPFLCGFLPGLVLHVHCECALRIAHE